MSLFKTDEKTEDWLIPDKKLKKMINDSGFDFRDLVKEIKKETMQVYEDTTISGIDPRVMRAFEVLAIMIVRDNEFLNDWMLKAMDEVQKDVMMELRKHRHLSETGEVVKKI